MGHMYITYLRYLSQLDLKKNQNYNSFIHKINDADVDMTYKPEALNVFCT